MIAISYRREDSAPITGRIYDRLEAVFGRDRVFIDLDSIPFGVDFRTHISESLNRCDILLVVIGPHWLGASADGSRRIDDPTDFVRLEVAQALVRDIRVIPLLIDRTEMPSSTVLPDDLKRLAFRNALRVDSGADFRHHMERLCNSLQPTPRSSTPTALSPKPIPSTSSPPTARSGQPIPSTSSPLRLGPAVRPLLGLAVLILTLTFFGFLGFRAGESIANATNGTIGFVGAVPLWLFGMWFSYFLWQRIQRGP
jgi:hypothetical protein